MRVDWALDHPDLLLGLVEARGVRIGPAGPNLDGLINEVAARKPDEPIEEELRLATRDLLRRGGFKPTGRNKPSSEYIANAAARGAFPRINNVVDVANLVSLESGLPVSLLDADKSLGEADHMEVRFGHPGERFVFNRAGQEIDVSGLISIARGDGPAVGNPVKDAMLGKTADDTVNLLAIVYAPSSLVPAERLAVVCEGFARLLAEHAAAEDVSHRVVGPGPNEGDLTETLP